jgi:hypothetical protein
MAASLPGLPAELLVKIVENEAIHEAMPFRQRLLLVEIRTTCREIHAKLIYFFGSRYLKDIEIKLAGLGMRKLQAIVDSPLRVHVRETTIDLMTLFKMRYLNDHPDTTDASQSSWYSSSAMCDMDISKCECSFNKDVANIIVDGSISQMLSPALSKFANLTSVSITPISSLTE